MSDGQGLQEEECGDAGYQELDKAELAGKKQRLILFAVLTLGVTGVSVLMVNSYLRKIQGDKDLILTRPAMSHLNSPTSKKAPTGTLSSVTEQSATDDPNSLSMRENYGESFRLKPFRINLASTRLNSYVQLEIIVEHARDSAVKNELEKRQPQLRNVVIFTVQKKTKAFLLSHDGREVLRKEIRIAMNQVMKRKIDEVYISEFLVE